MILRLQCVDGWPSGWNAECQGDIQKTVPSADGNISPHQSKSHLTLLKIKLKQKQQPKKRRKYNNCVIKLLWGQGG